MRDLTEYGLKCMELLDESNILYGNVVGFEVNTRARHRWGQCEKTPQGYKINISQTLLDERNEEKGLITTIIHELLHTCPGCMNHGANWKKLATQVNQKYGLNVKRTNSATEQGVKEDTRPQKNIKHKFVCKGCGAIILREKESKFTKNYEHYHCAICKNGFEKIF